MVLKAKGRETVLAAFVFETKSPPVCEEKKTAV
jgi:hypothetical protein